jgi:hypothetical protein
MKNKVKKRRDTNIFFYIYKKTIELEIYKVENKYQLSYNSLINKDSGTWPIFFCLMNGSTYWDRSPRQSFDLEVDDEWKPTFMSAWVSM